MTSTRPTMEPTTDPIVDPTADPLPTPTPTGILFLNSIFKKINNF